MAIAEHMLQAVAWAAAETDDEELVAAALLRDTGHLVQSGAGIDERDRHHSAAGQR